MNRPVTTLEILRAGDIPGMDPVPDLVLRTTAAPDDRLTFEEAQDRWCEQGQEIAEALYTHLPGGVVDQVLAALMLRRASALRVRL